MKLLNRLICHFKGHVGLQRNQDYDNIYYLLENSGAFCQGLTHIYSGRLYHCSRCGELHIVHDILSWELQDLISDTLKDLPKIDWAVGVDYSVINRLYKKELKL